MKIKCDICLKETHDIGNFDLLDDRENAGVKIGYCNICVDCYEQEIKNYKEFLLLQYKLSEDITKQMGLCNHIHLCFGDYGVVFTYVNDLAMRIYMDNPSEYKKHELTKNLLLKFYSRRQ